MRGRGLPLKNSFWRSFSADLRLRFFDRKKSICLPHQLLLLSPSFSKMTEILKDISDLLKSLPPPSIHQQHHTSSLNVSITYHLSFIKHRGGDGVGEKSSLTVLHWTFFQYLYSESNSSIFINICFCKTNLNKNSHKETCYPFNSDMQINKNFRKLKSFQLRYFGILEPGIFK